jgi:hypothetical protein
MSGRILCGALLAAGLVLPAHAITFEERVAAQRAIEQVYWKHRIWPQENPGPKPPLSAVLSDAAIRARVEGYLRESNALERYWQRPITASALQAELDRMVKSSRDPELLRELFAALGDDPALIAETVARQTLADRLVRNWYAHDGRFHGGLKKRAEAASAACGDAGCMRSMGGRYVETTLNQSAGSEDDWERIVDRWAGKPRGRPGTIEETADGYAIHAVLRETADTLTIASVVWDKTPFDVWWGSQGSRPRRDHRGPLRVVRARSARRRMYAGYVGGNALRPGGSIGPHGRLDGVRDDRVGRGVVQFGAAGTTRQPTPGSRPRGARTRRPLATATAPFGPARR